jgi:hypothetical protein
MNVNAGKTYLPPQTELLERPELLIAGRVEQMTIDHRVQEPVPVLPRHVRDEPRVLLSVEPDLLGKAALDQEIGYALPPGMLATNTDLVITSKVLTIDEVAVELETGIVEDKVDPSSTLILEFLSRSPTIGEVVVENVLLGPSELFAAGSLQPLDLLLGHVDEQRQIGRVTP